MPWAPRPAAGMETTIRVETRCTGCGTTWSTVPADSTQPAIEEAQKRVVGSWLDHPCVRKD